ncbi:uncharacterized protein MONBRDRAFT_30422 [Monosiga brevicollis MX1]|uniref:alpha-L-fucosidase n=1 Tax=Monosiga brevicollis TaxID=81824 RepID=A9VDX2_MONBE|nr:uncharacterized protein MONBRDRAFT_30422 [Monosiga brevicollis MX1]EDQ84293.1 predicted protein [Monosiga brevicollis MX1]|eukprot:XP_001750923.1 hypothetical protein [Monosiga brevicollis MX1]
MCQRLLLGWAALVLAVAGALPACNMTVDPANTTRTGSDYDWIELPINSTVDDCVALCCQDEECQAFTYNTAPHVCTSAPAGSQHCCGLKSAVPDAHPSSYNGIVITGHKPIRPAGIPRPSVRQLEYMDMGLTQFMHFSVTTFGNIEHDCVDGSCLPASIFNPTAMGPDENGLTATDQWVQTAVDMGAGEICLTAHHEGGFCLWPSNYSNYTVMQSPYPHDIVADFVASCHKYNIRPCFYIGPNANGYFTQVLNYTAERFYHAQMGMITEVLTRYGFISRLWWDHFNQGCGGLSECPACQNTSSPYCFPQAWHAFEQLVRNVSNETLLGTGPDVRHSGGGETGVGDYPVWNAINSTYTGSFGPLGYYFQPREADATIQNPGDAWFWKANHSFWNASQLWNHYMLTVGRGENFILNMPPDTTGRIPAEYVAATTTFGNALRESFARPTAVVYDVTTVCSEPIELDFPEDMGTFTCLLTREDLTQGQMVKAYTIEIKDDAGVWHELPITNGGTVGNRVIDLSAANVTYMGTGIACNRRFTFGSLGPTFVAAQSKGTSKATTRAEDRATKVIDKA